MHLEDGPEGGNDPGLVEDGQQARDRLHAQGHHRQQQEGARPVGFRRRSEGRARPSGGL